ncbi:TolB amino-terminal domain-containing protein [Aeromonas sp. RU39B]|uniref:FlgO family outer membrane protein n=1 Tax=Aeromonas sp. RU39B TaxID=1907416 RepID=UPI0009543921|nr:FlgO family outer membrane protein [Aeromonas sp. RU39B]SIQ87243.1 TolB amino-terminal domain-containing protein [Aeromonas sp. RU39B]
MKRVMLAALIALGLISCTSDHIDRDVGDPRQAVQGMELNWLVARMADQLMEKRSPSTLSEPIAVASFVDLDTLQDTNWMGQQIQESFIYELNRRGEVVVDFKLTGAIKVTLQGDFVMSRNYRDLESRLPIARILVGTFSRNKKGVLVNARIIDMRTKMVETSAQSLVPQQYLTGANNSFGRASINRGYIYRSAIVGPSGRLVTTQ